MVMRIRCSQALQPNEAMDTIESESFPIFDFSHSICCHNTTNPSTLASTTYSNNFQELQSLRGTGQVNVLGASLEEAGCSSTAVTSMSATGIADGGKHQVVTEAESIGNNVDLDLPPCEHYLSMTSSCDPTLCRGVLLHKALRRLGLNFESNQGSHMEYNLSEQTPEIDDFISHDWRTGRWSKLCSMLIVYNGRLAIVASNLVATSLCALQTDAVGLLPRDAFSYKGHRIGQARIDMTVGRWCVSLSGPIFLLFLCVGHNLAVLFSRGAGQRRVFVDKLCICQTDPDLKTKGIRALAGILKQSRRLVILWSPRYFTRLWCVYELTSWAHHQTRHRQPKQIRFEPVAWGHIIFGVWLFTYALCLLWSEQAPPAWLNLSALVVFVSVCHYLRLFTQELVLIPDQVANFHVEASECFCCAVGHIHPQTGVSMPCDRELINGTLITWANSQKSSLADGTLSHITSPAMSLAQSMHHFDSEVSFRLQQWAKKSVGFAPLPYEYAMLALSPCTWLNADWVAGILSETLTAELYFIELVWMFSWAFLFFPVGMKVAMFLFTTLSRRCPAKKCCWICNFLITVACMLVALIVYSFLLYPMKMLMDQRNSVPYILATCAWVLATLALFNMDLLLRKLQRCISVSHE